MEQRPSRLTRRQFLQAVGAVGGAAAVLGSMEALRLVAPASEYRAPLSPPRRSDFSLQGRANGTQVLILGAGVAGLAAAYELEKAGYQVRVPRGPRSTRGSQLDGPRRHVRDRHRRRHADRDVRRWSVHERRTRPHPAAPHDPRVLPRARHPDRGVCQPERRRLVLQRIRERSRRAADGPQDPPPNGQGRLFRLRQRVLAKATSQGALDADLRPEDAERMVEFLRGFGALGPGMR